MADALVIGTIEIDTTTGELSLKRIGELTQATAAKMAEAIAAGNQQQIELTEAAEAKKTASVEAGSAARAAAAQRGVAAQGEAEAAGAAKSELTYEEQLKLAVTNAMAKVAAATAGVNAQTKAVTEGETVMTQAVMAGFAARDRAAALFAEEAVAERAGLNAAILAASKQAAATENSIIEASYAERLAATARNSAAILAAVEAGEAARVAARERGASLEEAAVAAGIAAQAEAESHGAEARIAAQAGITAATIRSTKEQEVAVVASFEEQVAAAIRTQAAMTAAVVAGTAARTEAINSGATETVARTAAAEAAYLAAGNAGANEQLATALGVKAAIANAAREETATVVASFEDQVAAAIKSQAAITAATQAGVAARAELISAGATEDEARAGAAVAARLAAAEAGATGEVAAALGVKAALSRLSREEQVDAARNAEDRMAAEAALQAEQTAAVAVGTQARISYQSAEMAEYVAAVDAAKADVVAATVASETQQTAASTLGAEARTRVVAAASASQIAAIEAVAARNAASLLAIAQGPGNAALGAVAVLQKLALASGPASAAATSALTTIAEGTGKAAESAKVALQSVAVVAGQSAASVGASLGGIKPQVQAAENEFLALKGAIGATNNPIAALASGSTEGGTGLLFAAKSAGVAAAAIAGTIYAIEKFSDAAQVVSGVREAFGTLTAQVGLNADTLLSKMRPASQGLISDLSLMKSVNESVILGFHATDDQMAEATRVTTLLARAMGIDAEEALDRFIQGVGRERPIMLARIGVIVKAKDAYAEYAQLIGKLPGELTPAEKVQAFFNASLESGEKAAAALQQPLKTLSQNVHEFNVEVVNAKNSTLDWLNLAFGESALDAEIDRLRKENAARSGVTKATEDQTAALKKLHDEQSYQANLKIVQDGPQAPPAVGASNSLQQPEASAALAGISSAASTLVPGLSVDFGKLAFETDNATEAQAKFNLALRAVDTHDAQANLASLGRAYSEFALAPVWAAVDAKRQEVTDRVDELVSGIQTRVREAKQNIAEIDAQLKVPNISKDQRLDLEKVRADEEKKIAAIEDPQAKHRERNLRDEGRYLDQLNAARVAAEGKWSIEAQELQNKFIADRFNTEIASANLRGIAFQNAELARDQAINNNNRKYMEERFDRSLRLDEDATKAHLKYDALSNDERSALEIRALTDSVNRKINASGLTYAEQKQMEENFQQDVLEIQKKYLALGDKQKIENALMVNATRTQQHQIASSAALQAATPNEAPLGQTIQDRYLIEKAFIEKKRDLEVAATEQALKDTSAARELQYQKDDLDAQADADKRSAIEVAYLNNQINAEKQASDKIARIKKDATNAELHLDNAITMSKAQQAAMVLSTLSSATSQIFGKSKAGAYAAAVMNTAAGITQDLQVPKPAGYILAAITAAMGAAQIATINSTSLDGGGSTPSASGGGGINYSNATSTPIMQTATGTTPVNSGGPSNTSAVPPVTAPVVSGPPVVAGPPVIVAPQQHPTTVTIPQRFSSQPAPTPQIPAPVSSPRDVNIQQPQVSDQPQPQTTLNVTIHAIDASGIEELFNDRTKARAFVEGSLRYQSRN